MFGEKPKCSNCNKEIKRSDVVFVKIRYPMYKGMAEITAFLRNEGSFSCEDCYNKKQTEFIHTIHPCLSVTALVIAWTVQKTVDSVLTGQSDGCLAFKHSEPMLPFKDKAEDQLE